MNTATKVRKLALTAGHYYYTSGKRCLKSLDPSETREWWLNDRIADKIENLLAGYDGIVVLRTDDTTGQKEIALAERIKAANNFGADFYLSIHHNAGIKGGSGGGIVAYTYTSVSSATALWQKKLYNALIAKTGLKGNRSDPLGKSNLQECRETAMPAVLLELGFMDSSADVPIILTEAFADKCAEAIVEVIVAEWGLTKKVVGGNNSNNNSNDVSNNNSDNTDNRTGDANNGSVLDNETWVQLNEAREALLAGRSAMNTAGEEIDAAIAAIEKAIA